MNGMIQNGGPEVLDGWRTGGMYSFGSAARLAGVSTSTVRNWLRGYTAADGRIVPPLFQSDGDDMVSFLQMIEIMVAGRFRKSSPRKKAIPIWKVRRAYDWAREKYQLQYPFAHLKLEAIGGFIVDMLARGEVPGSFQALDTPEQWTLPGVVKDEIDHIEYTGAWAGRWFPLGKEKSIVIDPKVSAGRPVISGRGVPVDVVWSQKKAGVDVDFIAKDFQITQVEVEGACDYWEAVAA